MGRVPIKPSVRFEVFKRDNFTCQYCGAKSPDAELQVDHVLPVTKGGSNNIKNLVTCCWTCNIGKNNVLITNIRHPEKNFSVIQVTTEIPTLIEESDLSLEDKEVYFIKKSVYEKYGTITKYFSELMSELFNNLSKNEVKGYFKLKDIRLGIIHIMSLYPSYQYFICHLEMWCDKFYCKAINQKLRLSEGLEIKGGYNEAFY